MYEFGYKNCLLHSMYTYRSSHPEVFLGKVALKICSKFTGKQSCRSAISIKLLCNFIEISLRHGCSPVNLLHVFRTTFFKDTSGWLLYKIQEQHSSMNTAKTETYCVDCFKNKTKVFEPTIRY